MGGKPYDSIGRIYQTTFLPATLRKGSSPDLVLAEYGGVYSWAYDANASLDSNHDGRITVSDLESTAKNATKRLGNRWPELVARTRWAEETLGMGLPIAALITGGVIAIGTAFALIYWKV
jgi:hypothetical protein